MLNQWILAYFFSDGQIETFLKKALIWIIDIALIASGILIIIRNKPVSVKQILQIGVLFFISFVITEICFRLIYPAVSPVNQQFEKSEYFVPKPYVMFGGKPNHIELNRLGYKEDAPAIQRNPNEVRIFLLGGSALFEGDTTISRLLENEFHAHGFRCINCFNWGMPASTSGLELAKIVFEIADSEPDIIVMYNGGNDFMTPLWADPRPGYPYNFFIYESNPLLIKDISSYPMLSLAFYGSKILRFLFPSYFINTFTRFEKIKKEVNYGQESWKNAIVTAYLNNVIKASKTSKAFGADFMLFFQPLVYFKDKLSKEEQAFQSKTGLRKYITCLHEKFNYKIDSVNKQYKLNYADLSNIFDTCNLQTFADDIHTLPKSKHIIAVTMYKQMIQKIDSARFSGAK